MNYNSKKVKFTLEEKDTNLNNFQKGNINNYNTNISDNNKKNFSNNIIKINEEENDEILINRKRNLFGFNKKAFNNKNTSENYLDYTEFKNSEKIYSYSNNKSYGSSIKKIDYFIIKQTPEKEDNYAQDESRFKYSNYKFSSKKKIITAIENTSGIKAFDNINGVIENYYLEKRSNKDYGNRQTESK